MRARLALALTLVAASSTSALALKNERFEGKPDKFAAGHLNVGIWHDADGQHARFSTDGKAPHTFSGKVCADKMLKVDGVELEGADSVALDSEGHCLVFTFQTDGAIDGFDFRAEGAGVTFDLQLDGQPLPKKYVFIGRDSVHPKQQQFVLNRE